MAAIGIYEAKAHFSELVRRAAAGERITITSHGRPVVDIVPSAAGRRQTLGELLTEARQFRRGRTTTPGEIRAWVEEGRR